MTLGLTLILLKLRAKSTIYLVFFFLRTQQVLVKTGATSGKLLTRGKNDGAGIGITITVGVSLRRTNQTVDP